MLNNNNFPSLFQNLQVNPAASGGRAEDQVRCFFKKLKEA